MTAENDLFVGLRNAIVAEVDVDVNPFYNTKFETNGIPQVVIESTLPESEEGSQVIDDVFKSRELFQVVITAYHNLPKGVDDLAASIRSKLKSTKITNFTLNNYSTDIDYQEVNSNKYIGKAISLTYRYNG